VAAPSEPLDLCQRPTGTAPPACRSRSATSAVRNHPAVTQLLVKVLIAPSFVVGASLTARHFGPRVGGLIAGLPVVALPILLAYALAHGSGFAAGAAAGTLLGLISLFAFAVVYGRLARRLSWAPTMLLGWLAFAASTVILSAVSLADGVELALVFVAIAVGLALLPRPVPGARAPAVPPAWDLPLRAACAAALVLTLTAISGWLGPQLSGLLAPFPIITTVLATFTHVQRGAQETLRLLRGMMAGFGAYALFCFTLATSLRSLGTAAGFALATAVALLVQSLVVVLTGREGPVRTAVGEVVDLG
jgi:hypothetical protein